MWLARQRRRPHQEILISPSRSFPGVVYSGIVSEDGRDVYRRSGLRAVLACAGRRLAQCWVCGLRRAASVVSSVVIGRRRRSRGLASVGRIPGRRAPMFWVCQRRTASSAHKAASTAMASLRFRVGWRLVPFLDDAPAAARMGMECLVFLCFAPPPGFMCFSWGLYCNVCWDSCVSAPF